MKRMCCILLTVCFFLLLIPHAALTEEDEWKYRELEDGTIAITGYYEFDENDITIPEKIKGKTVSAIEFLDEYTLNDSNYHWGDSSARPLLTIPNSVAKIIGNPFADGIYSQSPYLSIRVAQDHPTLEVVNGCLIDKTEKRLIVITPEYIGIPDDVEILGAYCGVHLDTPIPSSVKTIECGAFRSIGVKGTVQVKIPRSVTKLDGNPFACTINDTIKITVDKDHSTLEIMDDVLYDKEEHRLICTTADKGKYNILPGTEKIERGAFEYNKKVSAITLPDSVKEIGLETFEGCSNLISINLPDGIQSIEKSTFNDCAKIKSIIIPDSVTAIGAGAFSRCKNLQDIIIPDGVVSIESGTFYECEKLRSITIPDSVTSIGERAFWGCKKLQSLTIPGSVTTIGDGAFGFTEDFGLCTSLQSITILDGATCVWENAFALLKNLKGVTIPDSVTSIGERAFAGCANLQKIAIPDNVISIGDNAFDGCASLQSITIPDSVRSIGRYAFENCEKLKEITIGNGIEDVNNPFVGCKNVRALTISGSIARWNFSDEFMAKIQTVVLGEGTELVEPGIFKNFTSLEKVTIPGSVKSIGESAFEGLKKLKSVEIGDGVVSIGRNAFADCPNLKTIAIPDSVTKIADSSFNQKQLTMTVGQGSVAEKYCEEHGIKYTYADK